jgi:hypothetical protein
VSFREGLVDTVNSPGKGVLAAGAAETAVETVAAMVVATADGLVVEKTVAEDNSHKNDLG